MPPARPSKADAPYPPGWEPFLAAITANLADDTPRLVFADWLQENGDETRAEFIRIQCDLFRTYPQYANDPPGARAAFDDKRREAWRKEGDLLSAHRQRWTATLPKLRDRMGWSFRRGFVFSYSATARQWLKDGTAVRVQTPLEHLNLSRLAGLEAKLLCSPLVTGLRRLFLPDLTTDGARLLADSPALDSLEAMSVGEFNGTAPDAGAARTLAASPRLANLTRLWVRSVPVADAIAKGLAGNAHLRGLQEAEFFGAGLGTEPFAQFVASPTAAGLRTLNLQANYFGDAGVRALTKSTLAHLYELNLRYNRLTAESARLLAAWPGLGSVRVLRLSGNQFGAAGVRELFASEHLTSLTKLELPVLGVHKPDREQIATLPAYQRIPRVTFS